MQMRDKCGAAHTHGTLTERGQRREAVNKPPRTGKRRSPSVEDAHTEPRERIITSAPTLIYGGRGMDGCSYIRLRVWTASFRARPTFGGREPHRRVFI